MNPLTKILSALRFVADHPLNRNRRFAAVTEYGFIQLAARLVPGEVCLEFPNQTRLLVSPRMKGAAHFIAPRLCEFEDMTFTGHFLKKNEMFADVGANIGAFTILAAGVAGASAVSFEPCRETFEVLVRNILINGLQERVRPVHAAVGRTAGTVQFSTGMGTENRIISSKNSEAQSSSVAMTTFDAELNGTPPTMIKVDVEGFETEVFAGAERAMQNQQLQAIIVERNGSGTYYGYDENALHEKIRNCGFTPCSYLPFSRELRVVNADSVGNIIYIRDLKSANKRLKDAAPIQLGDLSV